MNLVELMKKEISELNLIDKKDIQNHLYQRMGEIFEYDPYWKFSSVLEQYKIGTEEVDIYNIKNFYKVCFVWAKIAISLFKEFDIEAREEGPAGHSYVVTTIDNKDYQFDLMKEYDDIMRIKFGLKIHYHYNSPSNNDNRKYKNTNKRLCLIKQKLQMSLSEVDKEESIYHIFKTIQQILAFFEPDNVDIVSGVSFINYLLKYFIGNNYMPCNTRFYNKDNKKLVEIYSFIVKGKMYYYIYEKINNKYILSEGNEEKVREIINTFIPDKAGNLYLLKEQFNYLKNKTSENEKQPKYLKYKNMEQKIKTIKSELRLLTYQLSLDEYIYQVLKTIENMLPFFELDRENIEDGAECIQYLFEIFIGIKNIPDCIRFFDTKSMAFAEVLSIPVNGKFYTFFYKKIKGQYKFLESTIDTPNLDFNNYITEKSRKKVLS